MKKKQNIEETSKYPRILIVSVNPLSTTSNNGKTIASFFESYPKEKLAQLYFHREIPTSNVCQNYYKISDEDMINNFFRKNKKYGKQVSLKSTETRLIPKNINDKLKTSQLIRFVRSLMWLRLDLEKKDIKIWLDEFNPEIIFFCGGNANYLYSKVKKIVKKYQCKIITYITDDYVLLYPTINLLEIINRIWTRRELVSICNLSSYVFTIGKKMSITYYRKFGIVSSPIANLVEMKKTKEAFAQKNGPIKFLYTGGLHSNRWQTLRLLGLGIERINRNKQIAELQIYSCDKVSSRVLNSISIGNSSKFCGALDEKGVRTVQENADILVHVESFKKKDRKVTYLSVSTKISEYMAMKKCVLAIGPNDIASIEYIDEIKAGFVIKSKSTQEIDSVLDEIIKDQEKRNQYAKNGYKFAENTLSKEFKQEEFKNKLLNLKKT